MKMVKWVRGDMEEKCLSKMQRIKEVVRKYINTVVPGLLNILDYHINKVYGASAIELLFSRPSAIYDAILDYYRDTTVVEFMIRKLFIKPIALEAKASDIEEKLFRLIKEKKDSEFINTIKSIICE